MTIRKIIFCFAIVLAIHPILSKDQTHEKPDEYPEPDTHRIFIRGLIGNGRYTIPEMGESKSETVFQGITSTASGFPTLFLGNVTKDVGTLQIARGLEYRYKDMFRILHDERTTAVDVPATETSATDSFRLFSGGIYDWEETVTKTGIAYFHPITQRFNLGFYLRNYTVEQGYVKGFRGLLLGSAFTAFSSSSTGSYAKATGLVPGIGLEFKIFRWLDFTYSYEMVNLKGDRTALTFEILAAGNTAFFLIGGNVSSFTFSGTSQNAGFTFKYSTWFSNKIGIVTERFERKYNSYFPLTTDPTTLVLNSVLYPSLIKSTSTFNNLYWQIEFSKGF